MSVRRYPAAIAVVLLGGALALACRSLPGCATPEEAERDYARGVARLDEARDGEHLRTRPFEEAMALLRRAAETGNLPAQSLYGRTLFATRFAAESPRPDQRDDYVSALAFLRLAARRGDAEAARFLPALAADEVSASEPPLDGVPEDWLRAALARADAWTACGDGSTRGVQP